MPNDRSLEGWMENIRLSAENTRNTNNKFEEEFFAKNKPLKEFSIERDGELVEYGIWQWNNEDDLMIMFKINGKYSFRNKMIYDKPIVRELCQILK